MDAGRIGALVADCGLVGLPLSVAIRSKTGSTAFVQGRWPDGTPVTSDSRFYGASIAKQLTGATIARLVRHAGLDPDDAIGIYLPELPAWRDDVSIRHLLHHLGGLPDANSVAGPGHWDAATAMGILRDCPVLPASPGSRFRYSNLGYVCLAALVERVSDISFAEFAHNHLFDPLGLSGLGFFADPDFPQLVGMGGIHPRTVGDGGLWTTAASFADWLDHQNRDTLGIAHLVQAPYGVATDYGWGIGIRSLHDEPLYIHGGGWPGAFSKAVRCPALGISIVALAVAESDVGVVALVDALLYAMAAHD